MDTTFLEALETTEKGAKRFKIRVISAGVSKNGNYYSPAALREAAPLFDGVRVLVRSDEDHIKTDRQQIHIALRTKNAPNDLTNTCPSIKAGRIIRSSA